MINEETRRKLHEMNFSEFLDALDMQQTEEWVLSMSFSERLTLAVDYAYQEKKNNRVKRLIRSAKLRIPDADIHSIYYHERGLDKNKVIELGTCHYVQTNTDIILNGFAGSGKTYLACSLGKEACKRGYRVLYVRLPDLLMARDETKIISGSKGIKRLLKKYSSYGVLIIDEWLTHDISLEERDFILELIELRYDKTSTVFCTQYPVEDWHARLGGGVNADALMDRIVHNAFKIFTGNVNMRAETSPIKKTT